MLVHICEFRNLTGKGLSGPIPPQISQLVYLEVLELDDNQIVDPIPLEIGKLIHLRRLSINSNSLMSLPPEALLSCNLTYLYVRNNLDFFRFGCHQRSQTN